MSTSDVNFYSNFGANLIKCQLLNISIHVADTDTGVCSDIGNTNTSIHPVSYCPIWDEAVLIPNLTLCAVWGRHGNAGRRTPVRVCGAQQHASRVHGGARETRTQRVRPCVEVHPCALSVRPSCKHSDPSRVRCRAATGHNGARPAEARRAPRGRDRATPHDRWITYQHLKPSQKVKSPDFLIKISVNTVL